MSKKLIEMLKRHEGSEKHAYQCPAGHATIGVGRCIESGVGLGLTDEEIEYLLANDIVRTRSELSSEYAWFDDLDHVRQDAMIDIAFNLGATKLRKFRKALSAMSLWHFDLAASEFANSRWSSQVGQRAEELCEMIATGEYKTWH